MSDKETFVSELLLPSTHVLFDLPSGTDIIILDEKDLILEENDINLEENDINLEENNIILEEKDVTLEEKRGLSENNNETQIEKVQYLCGLCSESFKQLRYVRSHFAEVHDQIKPYECNICQVYFVEFRFIVFGS